MLPLSRAQAIAWALIIVAIAVLALAVWARARAQRSAAEPAVGALRLGLSQAVSGYSFWILLGVSAAAYFRGLSAIWIAVGILVGAGLNWLYVGPRLFAARQGATHGAAAIVFLILTIAMIAQLRVAGEILATGLGVASWIGVASLASLGFLPALIGGRRAAIDAASLSALLVPPIAVFLMVPALLFAGSAGGLLRGLASIDPAVSSWLGSGPGAAGIVGALGGAAFGFTLLGQPAVLDQFAVARNARVARLAGVLAIAWFTLLLVPMLLFGWSALVLYSSVDDPNLVLLDATARLLPPAMQSLPVIAAALAVSATIGHQLVTLGAIGATGKPARARLIMSIAAALTALAAATTTFGSVRVYLLTLVTLGVALGPVLLVRLAGGELRPAASALAIRIGLIAAIVLLLVRNELANSLAVAVSFLLALGVAFAGRTHRLPD